MANPIASWSEWSQTTIEPYMEAVIHFPSGDVTIYDGDIAAVNIVGRMFESSHILFGPPEPMEATLEIVDIEQNYNPVYNDELTAGTQVDFYLGLRKYGDAGTLGDPQVIQWDEPQQTIYNNQTVWTTVFYTESMLRPGHYYLLVYEYQLDSGEIIQERIQIPDNWFDRTIYAITHLEHVTVIDAQLYEYLPLVEQYGVFYTREWTYDTATHTASIDLVDAMNEALMIDNRPDANKPNTNRVLKAFITTLLDLYSYTPVPQYQDVYSVRVQYTFYEETQAQTIAKGIEACQAAYFFHPDGEAIFCSFDGSYDTDIIITDEDVESYNIQQSSAAAYDSVSVDFMNVALEQKQLLFHENVDLSTSQYHPFTENRVYNLEYVHARSNTAYAQWVYYDWNVSGLDYGTGTWTTIEAYGRCVTGTPSQVISTAGNLPYVISDNYYIQTAAHAQAIVDNLVDFMNLPFNTVELTLAGSYGIWPGARLHLQSNLYNIDADYTVIGINFVYTGSVHTTVTLQRRF